MTTVSPGQVARFLGNVVLQERRGVPAGPSAPCSRTSTRPSPTPASSCSSTARTSAPAGTTGSATSRCRSSAKRVDMHLEVLDEATKNIAAGAHAPAPLLGQLQRPAQPRHPAARDHRARAEVALAGHFVRGRQPASRARMDRVPRTSSCRTARSSSPASSTPRRTSSSTRRSSPSASSATPSVVGRENVIAGVDCGFATFAAPPTVVPASLGPSSARWSKARASPASACGDRTSRTASIPAAQPTRFRDCHPCTASWTRRPPRALGFPSL